ncbi:hypothetical protein [Nocardioides litoris]|uniref:hypothetical protein n=1 Tax=Nocardioides litoris TaxID=1926648 RepID=UPI00111F085D|nr:hypothetical protein [Nocardioides litoris]
MDALELTVDPGRPANAGRFFQLGRDLIDLLDEVSDLPVDWKVSDLRTGSAVVRLEPPADRASEARHLRLVVVSLAAAEAGRPMPGGWTPDAVRAAYRFAEHGQASGTDEAWTAPRLRLVSIDQPGPEVDLTPTLVEALAVAQPFERDMPGSVRGELVGVNVSRGNRASLRLPTKRVVRVGFPNSLRDKMKDALLQPVEVTGVLHQDGDGRIFKVRASDVVPLRQATARWVDLLGIDPDYLDGMTADEWLEAGRGEA